MQTFDIRRAGMQNLFPTPISVGYLHNIQHLRKALIVEILQVLRMGERGRQKNAQLTSLSNIDKKSLVLKKALIVEIPAGFEAWGDRKTATKQLMKSLSTMLMTRRCPIWKRLVLFSPFNQGFLSVFSFLCPGILLHML